jgi:hypothetical protein
MKQIALIGCSKQKLDYSAPAKELYQGSLFKAARKYVEAKGYEWAILSAKYGLVDPNRIIEPYNQRLPILTPKSRPILFAWGSRVNLDAWMHWYNGVQMCAWPVLVLFAGASYRSAFDGTFGYDRGMPFEAPLARFGIGEQMKWLREHA